VHGPLNRVRHREAGGGLTSLRRESGGLSGQPVARCGGLPPL